MTITNVVWLTSASETFTDSNKAAMAAAFDAQADWVARNVPEAPADRDRRGVALFQQVEDPRVVLETAHWSSSDEHGAWLASDEYGASSAPLGAHFDFGKLEYFHLAGDVMSPGVLVGSTFATVIRARVPADKKDEFKKAWDAALLDLLQVGKPVNPRATKSGLRVPGPDPDTEEFVFFIGWPSVEVHREFAKTPRVEYITPLRSIATDLDVKYYNRVL